ncbi:hypothetical protein PR048_013955 [Dryococelus australis]|uniref:Uncharacterized protein n=1 Tax=Dryococelus australis TaxID=614101 RepID=A0ABQ9HU49_9NEOP|nr:hypothetical protein PR048_013955 [Dryococelus australis]
MQAAKAGLQITFEKTHFITNIKSAPKKLVVNQGKTKQVEKFKYLGEWVRPNICEKEAFMSRIKKMEMANHLTKDVYDKRSVSFNAKPRHYCSLMEQLESKERKILRKILGPVKENSEYRSRHNHELYLHVEKITDTIRKRRIAFYGHLTQMSSERLSN